MPFDVRVHYPQTVDQEERTRTHEDVVHFGTEFGDTNEVRLEFADGSEKRLTGTGLTVAGGAEPRPDEPRYVPADDMPVAFHDGCPECKGSHFDATTVVLRQEGYTAECAVLKYKGEIGESEVRGFRELSCQSCETTFVAEGVVVYQPEE